MIAVLMLSAEEIMVLTDRVQNTDTGFDPHVLQSYPLLLKLGSAYVDMLEDGKKPGEIPIAVTENETWLLRSKITSGDKSATDALFGVKLLCKLYKLLEQFNPMITELEAGGEDDEFTPERKAALHRWMGASS